MAAIKCKMCGGDLELNEGMTIAECEYCGTKQTVPNADNEKKLAMFERANRLRMANEFDKAAGIYENIIADFSQEAEAYWGVVLCKFGIEYVDDPASGKKVPTCHRSSIDSIFEDSDFEQACENADTVARRIYRDEAKVIEDIRKGIIEVSGKEAPYDIFICYKETDMDGNRTIDSVLAQEVYDALTEKGYRVFFSRITLEDKLGTEYEPYIFAALNSSKIMLAFGTDYENYNAVWVKNEWSRFLKLMAQDKNKYLIPCYKGIDAYDMPKEFTRFQAQDMGKIGAVQDLLRGIEKLLPSKQSCDSEKNDDDSDNENEYYDEIEKKLKRGQLHLEDGEWEKAYDCFDDAWHDSDSDEFSSAAHIGMVCANLRISSIEEFEKGYPTLPERSDYEAFACAVESKAGYIMLSKQEWSEAEKFFDESLELNPEYAFAYVGKLMASHQIKCEEDISDTFFGKNLTLADDKYYQRALRFADTALRERLENYKKSTIREMSGTDISKLEELRNRWSGFQRLILATNKNTYALTSYGAVLAIGDNEKHQCNTAGWRDITAIAAGCYHVVGLKKDGTVVAVGAADQFRNVGQCQTESWNDVKEIAVADSYTVGLKSNGSIVVCGNAIHNKNDMSSGYLTGVFKNIIAQAFLPKLVEFKHVFASKQDLFGLNKDGTVEAYNTYDACRNWRDIVDVVSSPAVSHVIGLTKDRTVVAYGKNEYGECDVDKWSDIVAVAVGGGFFGAFTVGLRYDGTVVAVGSNEYGQCRTSTWRDIVAIAAGERHTVGLRANGTVVAVGGQKDVDYYGQCETSEWQDIVAITAGSNHTVGLKADGTVVAVGNNQNGQCDTQGWVEIITENPEKAVVRTQHEKARERRRALISAKDRAKDSMKELVALRDRLKQDFGTYSLCLNCGKKHVFEFKTCKHCGAIFEKGVGTRGIPYRRYWLPDNQGSCLIFQDGVINLLQRDSTGKMLKRMINDDNMFYEGYIDDKGNRIGEVACIDISNEIFYIFPIEGDGLYQALRKDGFAEFYHMRNEKVHGICEVVSADEVVSNSEYKDGERVM